MCRIILNSLDDPSRSTKLLTFSPQNSNGDTDQNTNENRKHSVLDEKALRENDTLFIRDQRVLKISQSYLSILDSIGEDPLRQGKTGSFFVHNLSV